MRLNVQNRLGVFLGFKTDKNYARYTWLFSEFLGFGEKLLPSVIPRFEILETSLKIFRICIIFADSDLDVVISSFSGEF